MGSKDALEPRPNTVLSADVWLAGALSGKHSEDALRSDADQDVTRVADRAWTPAITRNAKEMREMTDRERDAAHDRVVEIEPPNLILRVIWFLLVGWWLTGILSVVAWALNATIIGLPLGLWIINRLPVAATLRPASSRYMVDDGVLRPSVAQHPLLLRAIYFVLIGWWLSGLWMVVAYALLLTIVGMPAAFWMYGRIGAVTTLYRT